ncbi:MAG: class I SAM-dependent methyltransferase [Clostridiales bacterium]|nr:class I SAM-dependent methyltransferase [Clostridiales bacterium]
MNNKIVKINWDEMSQTYEDFTSDKDSYSFSIEWPTINEMMPNIKGQKVLDLGCGTGRFSFFFEEFSPRKILGVDISSGMLDIARREAKKINSTIEFQQKDIEGFLLSENQEYDFIFSSTTFHYIEDLEKLFKSISSILSNNGTCIISVIHPVYSAHYPLSDGDRLPTDEEWQIQYLDTSERSYVQPWIEYSDDVENFLSTSYHHTFSNYCTAVLRSGLKIEEIREPLPPIEWKEKFPNKYNACMRKPTFMILKLSHQ